MTSEHAFAFPRFHVPKNDRTIRISGRQQAFVGRKTEDRRFPFWPFPGGELVMGRNWTAPQAVVPVPASQAGLRRGVGSVQLGESVGKLLSPNATQGLTPTGLVSLRRAGVLVDAERFAAGQHSKAQVVKRHSQGLARTVFCEVPKLDRAIAAGGREPISIR